MSHPLQIPPANQPRHSIPHASGAAASATTRGRVCFCQLSPESLIPQHSPSHDLSPQGLAAFASHRGRKPSRSWCRIIKGMFSGQKSYSHSRDLSTLLVTLGSRMHGPIPFPTSLSVSKVTYSISSFSTLLQITPQMGPPVYKRQAIPSPQRRSSTETKQTCQDQSFPNHSEVFNSW